MKHLNSFKKILFSLSLSCLVSNQTNAMRFDIFSNVMLSGMTLSQRNWPSFPQISSNIASKQRLRGAFIDEPFEPIQFDEGFDLFKYGPDQIGIIYPTQKIPCFTPSREDSHTEATLDNENFGGINTQYDFLSTHFSSIDLSYEKTPSHFSRLDKLIEDDDYEYTKIFLAELKNSPIEEKVVNYLFSKFSEFDDGHPLFAYMISRDEGKKPNLETFKEVFGLQCCIGREENVRTILSYWDEYMQNNTDELIEYSEFLGDLMLAGIYNPKDEIVDHINNVIKLLDNKCRQINNLN